MYVWGLGRPAQVTDIRRRDDVLVRGLRDRRQIVLTDKCAAGAGMM